MDTLQCFLQIFQRDDFGDFLSTLPGDEAFPKIGLFLTLLHTEKPKLNIFLAFLSAIGLKERFF